jgi:photosystem II stability/assembly factor-like uncharacterized protein
MKINKFTAFLSFLPLFFLIMCCQGVVYADSLDNWVPITPDPATNNWLYGLTYDGYSFIGVGLYNTILNSNPADDLDWSSGTSGVDTHHLNGVAYGNGDYVAVGVQGTVLHSTDGLVWTKITPPTTHYLQKVAWGNGKFVAVGGSGTILTSSDGSTWYVNTWGTVYLMGVTYGNGNFVIVGDSGRILTSPDAVTWTLRTSGITNTLMNIAYGNGYFVAVGENGTILTASDSNLTAWTDRTFDITNWLNGIAYGNNTFVAVGDNGVVFTAADTDLDTWTERASGNSNALEDVAYDGSGKFAAVGGLGTILLDYGDPPLNPVRIWRDDHFEYFSSINTAYASALTDDAVEIRAVHFDEDVVLDADIAVTVTGGFNSTYTLNPSQTVINGTLSIAKGTLVVENLTIQ